MANTLPYLASPGSIIKLLGKIRAAAVPERFSQEFLNETLGMKGGTANSLIAFLKRMGFLDGTGTPTNRYKEYRNEKKSGAAIAAAVKQLYAPLYVKNESVHTLGRAELEGVIVEYTGKSTEDRSTEMTVSTFDALKKIANFAAVASEPEAATPPNIESDPAKGKGGGDGRGTRPIQLGYTINLQLPATKDVEVFNAIFQSLKQHLLEVP